MHLLSGPVDVESFGTASEAEQAHAAEPALVARIEQLEARVAELEVRLASLE
jgi:uncharacterized protein YceH (UPF0502 family)